MSEFLIEVDRIEEFYSKNLSELISELDNIERQLDLKTKVTIRNFRPSYQPLATLNHSVDLSFSDTKTTTANGDKFAQIKDWLM